MQICTFIVDDQEDVRLLIRTVIELADEGLFVGGEAASGEDAVRRVEEVDPAVIVLDEMMPGMDGISAAEAILSKRPGQPIVMCSAYLDDDLRRRAAEVGIRVCLMKSQVHQIPVALRALAAAAGE